MTKTDIVLIVPFQEKAAFGPRLLDSYLTYNGFSVALVYFKRRTQENSSPSSIEMQLLVDFIIAKSPLLIGISFMSVFRDVVASIINGIKAKTNIPIITGGVHATICPEDCLELADICCIGDGEVPLKMLLNQLKTGKLRSDIPNCYFRNGSEVIKNPMTYVCTDLDKLPFQDLTSTGKYFIEDDKIMNEDPYISYIRNSKKYDFKAYRGCPYCCTYCGNDSIRAAYGTKGKFLRRRSVENVILELKMAKSTFPDLQSMGSYDEVFLSDPDFVREFAERYSKEIALPLSCDTYITTASEEMVTMMANAGLKRVAVGIEAFSEEVRTKVYMRYQKDSDLLAKIKIFDHHGIQLSYDFILDNPYEKPEDIRNFFLDFITKLPRPCYFNFYSLCHLPKSKLTYRLLADGLITEDDIVGLSNKGVLQWKVTKKHARSPRITFWIDMMVLFSHTVNLGGWKLHIPISLIKLIGRLENAFVLRTATFAYNVFAAVSEGNIMNIVLKKVGIK